MAGSRAWDGRTRVDCLNNALGRPTGTASVLSRSNEVSVSSRRTLILIGAIAIGAFAAFALLNYIRGLEDSVYEDAQPVEVLIASENIPAGTPASEALTMVEIKQIPLDIRPADIVDPNLTDSITGLIALNEIPANQIIIPCPAIPATNSFPGSPISSRTVCPACRRRCERRSSH